MQTEMISLTEDQLRFALIEVYEAGVFRWRSGAEMAEAIIQAAKANEPYNRIMLLEATVAAQLEGLQNPVPPTADELTEHVLRQAAVFEAQARLAECGQTRGLKVP